ncbi:SMI1/KNR4 family protein [Roseiconus lacunae]|uniref:Knr4/Smi1-like domain-containing protein n=1 Tax=Roseiconus lacunae TaxID=2605694 RepID=A0ABT7PSM6_9BACT|nr:SMI1/KNR4 family protein [Roseiconus lacunae]MDM4019510.1 hypothetical protein [Roseiconus lacunae]
MTEHRLSTQDVLDIFRELPQHRGCAVAELDAVEKQLAVSLPKFYRDMMLLDAYRLYNTEIFVPVSELCDWTRTALHDFDRGTVRTLSPNDVIFAVAPGAEDNYYFLADGSDDPPVYGLSLNTSNPSTPNVIADALSFFTAEILRSSLRL